MTWQLFVFNAFLFLFGQKIFLGFEKKFPERIQKSSVGAVCVFSPIVLFENSSHEL